MKRLAFTIVELLVVLAVIAMAIGLLVPALRMAQLETRAVVCSSNVKQILNLLTIYDQQNGVFPYGFDDSAFIPGRSSTTFGDPRYGDKSGTWWFQNISYVPNSEAANRTIFWCPSRCVKDPFLPKRNILCGNYGVNRAICKDAPGIVPKPYKGIPLSLARILRPQNVLLVVDSGYSLISWEGATNVKTKPFETPRENSYYVPGIEANYNRKTIQEKEDAIAGRHLRKTVNAGYVDGHIQRIKAEKLFVTQENGVYKNIQTWIPNIDVQAWMPK